MFLSSPRKTILCTMSSGVSCPNSLVFCWPGTGSGPLPLTVHVDQEEVGQGAGLQHAQLPLPPQQAGAAPGGQVQRVAGVGGQGGGLVRARPLCHPAAPHLNTSGASSTLLQ